MPKATIGLYNKDGKPIRTVQASYWYAFNDPKPTVCICLDGPELERFFKGGSPTGALLQIEMKPEELKGELSQ